MKECKVIKGQFTKKKHHETRPVTNVIYWKIFER